MPHPPAPTGTPPARLDATFDSLVRRVEHAPTLYERQVAVDTLFSHCHGDTRPRPAVLSTPPTTSRKLP